ncbi:hypothetical protein [Methanobrevibacter thaueri]|uniref:Uncharacterized protein n=1 Tax=Methanobrevibacter thaueri TaxID=190975 RepID=A0A315YAT5_9EURY|nr:hypothetical protein [Methanobrevibacter thaueri]PWB87792.1 hypothetical protein MBBTH_07610 [Methanobrevibacter thaueri]
MNFKKVLTILLILTIALVSLSCVSAGLFDFLSGNTTDTDDTYSEPVTAEDALIKSSINLKYSEPYESSSYAYFYEGTGEYAEAAYWGPWYLKATFKFDVDKLYEMDCGSDSNYTIDMFKKDLKYIVKHDDIAMDDFELDTDEFLFVNNSAVTASLENGSDVLVIKCDYAFEEYTQSGIVDTVDAMKNASSVDVKLRLCKDFDHNFNTGSYDIDLDLYSLPIKVTQIS